MKRVLNNAGMTLMEMILVISLASILISASVVFLQPVLDSWTLAQSRSEGLNQAQYALGRMSSEIAALKDSSSVVTASASEFRFIDVDSNNIRYYLSGTNLMRNSDVLARGVQSLAFSYTNISEASVSAPAVSPSATDLWRVAVRVSVQKGEQSVTLESKVQPRNLKRS